MKESFNGLLSSSEAAKKWNIEESTIRKAISAGRLIEDNDIKKFGKQWVVKESSMERVFGRIHSSDSLEKISDTKRMQITFFISECLTEYCRKNKTSLKDATNSFDRYNIWNYLFSCYDYLHLGSIGDNVADLTNRIRRGINFV